MELTDDEKRMLNGDYGFGAQKCLKLLVQWGELFGAERMVKVDSVHLSGNFPTEAVREMSEGTERARAFSTLHAVYNPTFWRERFEVVVEKIAGGYGETDEGIFEERMNLLRKLGFLSTFTCSPYTIGVLPLPGNVMCWTGSSGQVISNTFFGARAGRESVSTCFAAAITGKTPLMGLLKKENRYAEILVKVSTELDTGSFDEADYGALGYYIGGRVGLRNTAIDGLPSDLTFEHGRMIVSPLPVSGACVMCHIIGVTPEANSIERVLGGRKHEMIVIGRKELAEAYEKLNNSGSKEIDMAVIGCPHLTIKEIGEVASLLDGKKVNRNVRLVLGVSRPTYTLAEECGFIDPIEKGGGIVVNSCVSALNPFMYVKDGAKITATNSARAAHYMQRMSVGKTKTFYGSMRKCVQAAIKGRWEE